MCMETSVPLLAVKYLSWRSTLYTAVCQCYFDCKATEQAEVNTMCIVREYRMVQNVVYLFIQAEWQI